MKNSLGIVAAGHPDTANAAATILADGGNAFDACLAALFASCVAEPVLSSLGGGGFLLTQTDNHDPLLYDFFAHTPTRKPPPHDLDFYPIIANFGTVQQEFHIGMGSIAVPGVVRGVFAIHRDLCSLPLSVIADPALQLARTGVKINSFQHYISTIVAPIIESSTQALKIHECKSLPGKIAPNGGVVQHEALANVISALIREGEDLFYQGELAQQLSQECNDRGGALRLEDLARYRVEIRTPLSLRYRSALLHTNPAPSIGGTLIAFTLALLERQNLNDMQHHGAEHLKNLANAMQITQQLRHRHSIDSYLDASVSDQILSRASIESYHEILRKHTSFSRGTTQISVADNKGNLASMTLSNGEGSGYVLPGTGIMLNNMLGEEDLNPSGFHQWPEDKRIASMMAPTLALLSNGDQIVTGSGGSNRIRSAILQVLINLIDFNKDVTTAVEDARIHFESGLLNLEEGFPEDTVKSLAQEFSQYHLWSEKNLFFGGAHTVVRNCRGELQGHGDSRRGGICIRA